MARSQPSPAKPPAGRNGLLLVAVVVGLLVVGGFLLSGGSGQIEVTVVNQSGESFEQVRLGDGPEAVVLGRLADGQTLIGSAPLADRVVVHLEPAKGQPLRGEYPFENRSGLSHKLQVTLMPALPNVGDRAQVGRSWESSSSAVLGYEVRFREPIDQLVAEPAKGEAQPGK
ncbi:MAG: hypothetical protein U0794_03805 [Isosphaeraceae bacterium]